MPEYAYQCKQCGQTQAHIGSASELPDWLSCPTCGGLASRSAQWYPTITLQGSVSQAPESETPATAADDDDTHVCYAGCAMHHYHPPAEDEALLETAKARS